MLGISGAGGSRYGYKAPQLLWDIESVETHLVASKSMEMVRALKTPYAKEKVCKVADIIHPIGDLTINISSGSFKTVGALVAPCSMHTLVAVTRGYSGNLLTHTASVVLKGRRSLALVIRETPLNLTYLNNIRRVIEMGGVIFPPVPALYLRPQSVDNILAHDVS